jgi:prepilin signal peptidase PulO-like enzyme (type II secretory pathway)
VTPFAVEAGQIFEVVWVGLLAGVAITAAYSFVVLGTGGYAEARRAGRGGAAIGWAVVAFVAFAAFVAGVVYGVHIMLTKG